MPQTVVDFDAVSIKNPAIKFDGELQSQSFGGIGKVSGETTLREIVKKLEGIEVKKKSTPEKMVLKLTAHVPVAPIRKLFGLSNSGLKPGIYAYGSPCKGLPFVLTGDVLDEFEDVTKLIAFPNCISNTGLTLNVENGADTVAELELEFTAYLDENKYCYYEAFVSEIEVADVTTWRTNFTPTLVKTVAG